MIKFWRRRRTKVDQVRLLLAVLTAVVCAVSLLLYPHLLPPSQQHGDLVIQPQISTLRTYRCDEVFPSIRRSLTLQLASVPTQHRIPTHVTNVTEYFSSPQHVAPYREYYFEYNPSIIRIPKEQKPTEDAVYLASFRVSNLNYCFHPEDRQRMVNYTKVQPKDWLGLALMNADGHILVDIIVDLAAVLRGAQDFRLFVLEDNIDTSSEQIYISSNDILVPLWLSSPQSVSHGSSLTQLPMVFGRSPAGENARQQLEAWVAVSSDDTMCAPCAKPRPCGKNFHFFASQGQLWAEVWPSAPHLIRSVDSPCQRKNEPRHSHAEEVSPVASFRNKELDLLEATAKESLQRRAKAPPWLTRGRGSACCLPIQNPRTGESLFMGIAHSKTLGKQGLQPNHYLSTLYAFADKPPFALVAQSGYFCLPFPEEDETNGSIIPMVDINRWRILRLGDELLYQDCPRIHFVSGMTLDVRDPNMVIIAYGINDCVSRFVKVLLSDLLKLLFFGK